MSTAVYNLRKTNQILQNLLQLRDLSQNDISTISILISKLSLSLNFEDQAIAYAEIKALREGRKVRILFNDSVLFVLVVDSVLFVLVQ
ncbi:hypothetical protein CsSME_00028125 [Camellia sinensis var. sinensis]